MSNLASIQAQYSSAVPFDHAICMPSKTKVNLKTKYEVPEGTTQMIFNPRNIPDIAAALEGNGDD